MFLLSLKKPAVKDTAMKVGKSIVKKTPPKNQGVKRERSTGTKISEKKTMANESKPMK